MKRIICAAIALWIGLAGCQQAQQQPPIVAVSTVTTAAVVATATDSPPTATASPLPATATATALPTLTPTPAPTASNTPTPAPDLSILPEGIFIYPAPQLYTGDAVTFQLYAVVPDQVRPQEVPIQIRVDDTVLVEDRLGGYRNLNGDAIGLYQWVWAPQEARTYTLHVELDPNDVIIEGDEDPSNNLAQIAIDVLADDELTPRESAAQWHSFETPYANIHVVQGTAAWRDRAELSAAVDNAVLIAAERLQIEPVVDRKTDIYFVDRVIGQGGYAGNAIVISYLDRNYSGGTLDEVLIHESVHVLDRRLESEHRITFLIEGFAVWGAGGHYKPEDLNRRAAALLYDSDRYIPLPELVNDFYPAQHEVGYLEAGAFVKYLIDSYGYPRFRTLYSDLQGQSNGTIADGLSHDLSRHYGKTLTQLEQEWQLFLRNQPYSSSETLDLELTISYYELMRDYQQRYDPTAYYLYAWLPVPAQLREQGLTADLTRHPKDEVNVVFETMLQSVDRALRRGDYDAAQVLLDSVRRSLVNGQFLDPLAANYQKLVQKTRMLGYEAHAIELTTNNGQPLATVKATTDSDSELITLLLALDGVEWTLSR